MKKRKLLRVVLSLTVALMLSVPNAAVFAEESTAEEAAKEEHTAEIASDDDNGRDEVSENEEEPSGDDPSEDDPSEDDPSEDDPSEDDPSEDDPSEDDPFEDDPSEDDPSEDDPSEDDPSEDDPEDPEETSVTYSIDFVTGDNESLKSSYQYMTVTDTLTIKWKVMKRETIDGETKDPEEVSGVDIKYDVTITKADNTKEEINNTGDSSKTFVESQYKGSNTIKVKAYFGKEEVGSSVTIEFVDGSSAVIPGNMPSGGGISGSTSGSGAATEGIVPGTALVSSHTSGTKDMTLYSDIVVTRSETEPEILLGDTGLAIITNNNDYLFDIVDNTMMLSSASSDATWTLSGLALKTLKDGGIEHLQLCIATDTIDLNTDFEPCGYLYGKLRSQGNVPSDFVYTISAEGITVSVKGNSYDVDNNSELTRLEECV